MQQAVIVGTARTPIGRARKGSLRDMRPDDLGGLVVKELVSRFPMLEPQSIEDVVIGTAVPEGQQGLGIGRIVAALAGLPETVPGNTVSRACASSLQAIQTAAHAIRAGEGSIFVAGGVESVSQVPGTISPESLNPRLLQEDHPDFVSAMYTSMLQTAENVASRYGISRERMDELALRSQNFAVAAGESGFFTAEIVPVTLPDGTVVAADDGPRAGTTLAGLSSLAPILGEGYTVTAGNACALNDGAAAVLMMSADQAAELGITPLARVVASAVTGLDPEYMGVGPIEACRKVLQRAGLTMNDIDIVELNEAFAAQVLAVTDALAIDLDRQLNPYGGAIALGHPFGMTGARMMTTLLHGLQDRDGQLGLETMCIGGGMGMAMVVERLS